MGTETLPDNTTVAAGLLIKSSDFLTVISAMQAAFVGRNTSGVPASGQSLGTSLYPWGNVHTDTLTVDGSVIDLSGIVSPANRIVSGKTRTTSGQPLFIDPDGTTNAFTLEGLATNLVLSIDSDTVTVSTDIDETGLTLAPSSNNTCTINDTTFNDQYNSKYYGEIDAEQTTITIDAAESEITSRVGQMIALKTDTSEIMWGWLKSTTEFVSVKRGYFLDKDGAPIVRETLIDNEVLTLLETGWIFVENDGTTLDVSYLTPVYSFTEPATTTGQYWYDMTNQTWKRYSGAAFVQINRVPVGLCVMDTTDCIAARAFDFYQDYKDVNSIDLEVFSDEVIRSKSVDNIINVYGTKIQIPYSMITFDNTADMETGSVAKDFLYYLYMSTDGERFISVERPYNRIGDLKGKYHPYNNWRYIGAALTDATSDWLRIVSVDSTEDIELITTDERDREATIRMIMALKINTSDSLQTLISSKKVVTDQFISNAGIDTVNSSNVYYQSGNKRITNDGVGGFSTTRYLGTELENKIDVTDNFTPDLVWIKNEDFTDDHNLYDVIRGVTNRLSSNLTAAEASDPQSLKTFTGDTGNGFTLGTAGRINRSGDYFVAWCWACPTHKTTWAGAGTDPTTERTNTNTGMSIIQYTGNSTGAQTQTFNHSLAAVPAWILVKKLSSGGSVKNWCVYHQCCGDNPADPGDNPEDYYLSLDLTMVQADSTVWNDTAPTGETAPGAKDGTFTIGSDYINNENGETYIAYLFAEVAGFSKFGTYEGNGTTQGIPAGTPGSATGFGFEPEFILYKNIDDVTSWVLNDNTRGAPNNLYPNLTNVEDQTDNGPSSIDSDGFTVTGNLVESNKSGDTYVYIAFGAKGAALDIDLITEAQTAQETPERAILSALFEQPDSDVTLNTDLKAYGTRIAGAESQTVSATDGDGKPYWVQGDLKKAFDVNASIEQIRAAFDLSGQGAGTALSVRLVGANTKKTYFEGLDVDYRGTDDE